MEFEAFEQLFIQSLDHAVASTEERLGRSIPKNYEILLYAFGYNGEGIDVEIAAMELYIDENWFYAIIDIAVMEIDEETTRIFVRPSGHPPVPFEKTWNTPPGAGPFKYLIAHGLT